MYCPFIYAKFSCEETIAKIKAPEIRIACYENKCPAKLWEPLKTVGTFTIGNHCKFAVNICEQCSELHKCKKSGENKDSCRQQRIDGIFRTAPTEQSQTPAEPAAPPAE
jgi:hypothetical protein